MAEGTNTTTPGEVDRAALDQIAKEIGEKGAKGDPITLVLAKGVTDGLATLGKLSTQLAELAKGKKAVDDEPDGDEGDGGGDDGGDDDKGKGKGGKDDAPGYEDMEMGRAADLRAAAGAAGAPAAEGTPTPTDKVVLDVTTYMFETGDAVRRLEKAQQTSDALTAQLLDLAKAQQAQIAQQQAQIELLGKMVETSTTAVMSTIVPLAKAVTETRAAALEIPEPSLTPRHFRRPVAPPDAAYLGGDKRVEAQLLMKAYNRNVLSSELRQRFATTRRFDDDDAKNAAKRAEIEALASV